MEWKGVTGGFDDFGRLYMYTSGYAYYMAPSFVCTPCELCFQGFPADPNLGDLVCNKTAQTYLN